MFVYARSVPPLAVSPRLPHHWNMPLPGAKLDPRIDEHERAHRQAQVDRRRDAVRTALLCLFWCAAGLALIGLGFHLESSVWALPAFYAGVAVGNAGIILTLLAAYQRGEKRGDW